MLKTGNIVLAESVYSMNINNCPLARYAFHQLFPTIPFQTALHYHRTVTISSQNPPSTSAALIRMPLVNNIIL